MGSPRSTNNPFIALNNNEAEKPVQRTDTNTTAESANSTSSSVQPTFVIDESVFPDTSLVQNDKAVSSQKTNLTAQPLPLTEYTSESSGDEVVVVDSKNLLTKAAIKESGSRSEPLLSNGNSSTKASDAYALYVAQPEQEKSKKSSFGCGSCLPFSVFKRNKKPTTSPKLDREYVQFKNQS